MHSLVVAGQFRFVPSSTPPGAAVPEKGFSGAIQQPFIPVANLYMTHRLSDRWSLGFGAYAPFGLASNFTNFNDGDPANTKYVGRFAGTRAKLINIWVQPTVAYRLTQNSAISLGVAYVHTHLFLEQSFLNPLDAPTDLTRELAGEVFPGVNPNLAVRSFNRLLPEGRLRAAATAHEQALTLGYLYKHRRSGWSFGATYRTAVVNHLKGNASFAFTNEGALTPFLPADRGLDVLFPNQDITGTFVTPATYVGGVSKTGVWGGRLAFDFRFQDFKRFRDFPINFTNTVDAKGRARATEPERRLVFDFRNSYLIQAGFEKPVRRQTGMFSNLTWRAGYVFDYSPVVDKSVGPLFPDANRHSWTAGMTKNVGAIELTAFYQFMQFLNRTTNVPANNFQFTNGEYRNFAHLAGLGMRIKLGRDNRVD
jgi:long-chain fatty acid transport protein